MAAETEIKKLIETFLDQMGILGEVDVLETAENLQFTIRTPEAGLLIGEGGEHLTALNHLIKRLVEKKIGRTESPFLLDVNDYQKQRTEKLRDLARMQAQRVRYFKKELILEPMTSYERRIVHAALTEYPDIVTESTGEEPNRRVVIKPFTGQAPISKENHPGGL